MLIEMKSPQNFDLGKFPKIFFGGSIEQDKAIDWQNNLLHYITNLDCDAIVLNPRRDNWDSNLDHDVTVGSAFFNQVTWELEAIETSDIIVFYFDKNTISPVTLMELGLCLGKYETKTILIYCPKEYFRYANVKITSNRFNRFVYENENDFKTALYYSIVQHNKMFT